MPFCGRGRAGAGTVPGLGRWPGRAEAPENVAEASDFAGCMNAIQGSDAPMEDDLRMNANGYG